MNIGPPAVQVNNVTFHGEAIEITYAEPREVSKHACIVRTLLVDVDEVSEEVQDVIETLIDIIDKGLLTLRNPAQKRRGGADVEDSDADDNE